MFAIAFAGSVSAQNQSTVPGSSTEYKLEEIMISSVKVQDGNNSVPVPNGKGTVKFTRRNGKISNVVYTDAAGKSTRLTPNTPGTNGAPKPSCKYPLPDACFGSAEKVGMCMCRPTDLSSGENDIYTIGLLLPAIQKIRVPATGF
jgi:hypothetical protein